ncbi:MAG: sigma 54-interacting transcriptional regulator [Ignavibacteriae bacterium]|nr:PAS domain-containing protein [Ignavibacteriota bacterium]NOG99908.1 sigma 54-interacting transcriptional regulator [Ignavibacteriota bacterium]
MIAELTASNLDILNSLTESLFTVDKEFRILFMNSAAEKLTGFNLKDVKGKICKRVFECDLCLNDCAIVKALESRTAVSNLRSVISKNDGTKIEIKLNASILNNDLGEPIGGVVTFNEYDTKNRVEPIESFFGIVGFTNSMLDIYNLINEISLSNAAVLIEGETGTGKELVANAIQANSLRRENCYLKVNCSSFSQELLASELFGHVKGAFTDAKEDRIGRFELADSGTIFLDEIAEMPHSMQIQLLRVLQEGTFERVGEAITRKVDVRIIAATNRNLTDAIREGRFRQDLYYRLNVIPFHVPPLRERLNDIPPLTKHFIQKFNLQYNKNIIDIDDDAMEILMNHDFPGNVRELENIIEYTFVRTKKDHSICRCSLPCFLKQDINCGKRKMKVEKKITADILLTMLKENKWNKKKVAESLNVNRSTLWRYLKEFNIE